MLPHNYLGPAYILYSYINPLQVCKAGRQEDLAREPFKEIVKSEGMPLPLPPIGFKGFDLSPKSM